MGTGHWSNDFYAQREEQRKATNTPVFKHDADIRAGRVAQSIHERLDPSKMKNGVREARDSKEHPNSLPIIVGLDITGSMRAVPGIVQKRLGKLMTTILEKGIAPDPQICFLGIGDSHTDQAKLQTGQFESGLEMEDDLGHLWIEGMGGGTGEEGYELALLFAARKTATDAWEKHKRKGYCNTPDAPIWMADQTFKPIGEVQPGDKVMGWEKLNGHRSLVITTVQAVQKRMAENVVQVTMESGRVLKCTDDHNWLSGHHGRGPESGDADDIWTTVTNRYGKGALLSHVVDPIRPLSDELREDAAWLAGIYDGEGHCHCNSISQDQDHNPDVCKRIEQVLTRLGFDFNYRKDSYFLLGGLQSYVKILNLPITRRKQLLDLIMFSKWGKYELGEEDRPTRMERSGDRVEKIEPLPPQEVVSMQTTTHNYIAWGYASSNCFLIGDERAYDEVSARSLGLVFGGETPTKGIPLSTILKEAQERYHIHFIIPSGSDDSHRAGEFWEKLLGKGHVLRLSDPEQICDLIALTVGIVEGTATTSLEALTPAIKEAIDPVLASTKKTVADAKAKGDKTARL